MIVVHESETGFVRIDEVRNDDLQRHIRTVAKDGMIAESVDQWKGSGTSWEALTLRDLYARQLDDDIFLVIKGRVLKIDEIKGKKVDIESVLRLMNEALDDLDESPDLFASEKIVEMATAILTRVNRVFRDLVEPSIGKV